MGDVRLEGKTVLITGANTGIGKETAMDMARRGARVVIGCRDPTRGQAALEDIRSRTGNQNVHLVILDLASFDSIRAFTKKFNEEEQRLDVLINNAAMAACPFSKTQEGFETQFGVNHIGHFLLTRELLSLIKASAPSRIVNVSSNAYKGGKIEFDNLNGERKYRPHLAYFNSKLANILFTRELHRRLQGTGVTAYSLHPGVVRTEIARHHSRCSLCCWMCCCPCLCKTPEQGALTSIHCALEPGLETYSGNYFADCAMVETVPHGRDDIMAEQLWQVTEQLIESVSKDNVEENVEQNTLNKTAEM